MSRRLGRRWKGLRGNRAIAWFATFLLALQVIVTADHLGAAAAAAASEAYFNAVGFLGICRSGAPSDHPGAASDACPVCALTSLSATPTTSSPSAFVFVPAVRDVRDEGVEADSALSRSPRRYGVVRGPPATASA